MRSHLENLEMSRARAEIASSNENRQRAIASFPLRIADIANSMLTACNLRDRGLPLNSIQNFDAYIDLLEVTILKEFRLTFGHDMIANKDDE